MKKKYFDATVYGALGTGHKNAKPLSELELTTGLTGTNIRLRIEAMRESGTVIVNHSDGRGYFIPETKEEVWAYYKRMYSRAKKLLRSCYHLKQAVSRIETRGEQIPAE